MRVSASQASFTFLSFLFLLQTWMYSLLLITSALPTHLKLPLVFAKDIYSPRDPVDRAVFPKLARDANASGHILG